MRSARYCLQFGLLLFFAALILSSSPLLAQERVIQVKVVTQDGKPLDDVRVNIFALKSGDDEDEDTNRQGIATFDDLDQDVYRIWVREDRYAPALHEFILFTSPEEAGVKEVELVLTPGDPDQKFYFEDDALIEQAQQLLQEGVQSFQNGDLDEAAQKFNSSVSIDPTNVNAHLNLAIVYLRQGQWEPAARHLRKELELIEAYSFVQDQPNEALTQLEDQGRELLESIPMMRLDVEVTNAMQNRNFEDAIEKLKKMLEAYPDNADIYYNLALAQTHSEQLDAAAESIDKALELRPNQEAFEGLKNQIAVRQRMKEQNRLQYMLDEAQKMQSEGRPEEAIKQYKEILPELPPAEQAKIWIQIAQIRMEQNQLQQGVEAYQQAIDLDPSNADYRKALAQHYLQQKDFERYIDAYAAALDHSETPFDEGLHEVGLDLVRRGQAELAGDVFERVLEHNPQFAEAYYQLGMHYFYNLQDRERAREMLSQYLEMGENEDHVGNANAVLTVMEKTDQ